jgi:hypothetical protein
MASDEQKWMLLCATLRTAILEDVGLCLKQQRIAAWQYTRESLGLRRIGPRISRVICAPMNGDLLGTGRNIANSHAQCFANSQTELQEPMDEQRVSIPCVLILPRVVRTVRINDTEHFVYNFVGHAFALAKWTAS